MVSLLTPHATPSEWKILDQMTRKPAKVRFIDLFEISQVLDAIDRLKEQKS
ncbi:toxin-antitoxin system, toxin component [Burkholderia cenocepacia]|jgi:hypothetical protein|nr:toxin-antitoxin system, toxin component [Burkholderia cenocepacia]MBR8120677.1 toxin-antitoxin system, toxin component [Burkholderia cenocepacia]MBR8408315.1 toxin-antitoxin system, toxin component [Burkholderia cenocepacia]MDR8048348.1 toxin-antitoxin system, toxin component [Burkholderia cenocepacia]QUN39131.1 toxin-antitoxin system, toxin component [Burkholderia cenocepacia]